MAKSKAKNIGVWIILGLLFVGLMGFGAVGLQGNVTTVGTVGDKPLPVTTYYNELRNQIAVRSNQLGRPLSFPEAEAEGLPQRALQIAVAERSLDNEALQLGLSVGDETVRDQVLATPAFRGADGGFNQTAYREALGRSGLSVRDYETSLRDGAARALLQGAVFTGIPDPAPYGRTVAQFTREERSLTWATLAPADLDIALEEPSEEALLAHYEANPELYTSPEVRVIDYVWLTPAMIQDEVPVAEEELREEYEIRIDEFVQPERRLIERLVFSTEEAAAEAMAAIDAGETTFPALVEERGLTLEDVDAGDVTQAQMGDAGEAIFATEVGAVTGPHPSNLGPALFRVNAVLAARETTFEEALPDLREDEALQRALRVIEDQVDPINNLLAGGARLADVAEQTDMELGQIDWSAEASDGIAAYANFRDAALATGEGDFPELLELEDGGLFAIDVTEVRPPELQPFDDVRDAVIDGWEAEETRAAVLAEAEARAAQLRETVADFGFLDLDAREESGMTRRGFINGTPPNFLTEVFAMEPGEVRVLPNGDAAVIVRVDTVSDADAEDDAFAAEVDQVAERAGEGIAQDIYEFYTRSIQMQTDVQINEQALNAVHTNFR